MISFTVNDMTCGHCVSSIAKAIRAVDKGAKIDIDLASHLVKVEPTEATSAELAEAIKDAGYTPEPRECEAAATAADTPARSGCCCG